MTLDEALRYCEEIAVYHKRIARAAQVERDRLRAASIGNFDSVYDEVEFGMMPLEKINLKINDRLYTILWPELWINCYNKTVAEYKKKYGADKFEDLRPLYDKEYTPLKTYSTTGQSETQLKYKRLCFKFIFLIYACRDKLITLD